MAQFIPPTASPADVLKGCHLMTMDHGENRRKEGRQTAKDKLLKDHFILKTIPSVWVVV